jgi:hypothetical protein
MTVIPFFTRRAKRPEPGTGLPLPANVVATGTFRSPSGRAGAFTGTHRLERFVSQFGQLAAAGIFTGELTDSDGSHIGIGSRRHTAAVEVIATRTTLLARLGPVDVNLHGIIVTIAELSLDGPAALRKQVPGWSANKAKTHCPAERDAAPTAPRRAVHDCPQPHPA